jgi:hypothetical protein
MKFWSLFQKGRKKGELAASRRSVSRRERRIGTTVFYVRARSLVPHGRFRPLIRKQIAAHKREALHATRRLLGIPAKAIEMTQDYVRVGSGREGDALVSACRGQQSWRGKRRTRGGHREWPAPQPCRHDPGQRGRGGCRRRRPGSTGTTSARLPSPAFALGVVPLAMSIARPAALPSSCRALRQPRQLCWPRQAGRACHQRHILASSRAKT